MKKISAAFTAVIIVLCFALFGCANGSDENVNPPETPSVDHNVQTPDPEPQAPPQQETPEDAPDTPDAPADTVSDSLVLQLTAGANLRVSPSLSSQIAATLEKWTVLPYIKTENGWRKTVYGGKKVWVSANYSKTVEKGGAQEKIESIAAVGKTKLGYPYVYGAPRALTYELKPNPAFTGDSFDCSSFVQYVFLKGAGLKLQGDTRSQFAQKLGFEVSVSEMIRGDVIFFTNADREHLTGLERIGHVAIYLGDNTIMHTYSPSVGSLIEPMSALRKSRIVGVKRYF